MNKILVKTNKQFVIEHKIIEQANSIKLGIKKKISCDQLKCTFTYFYIVHQFIYIYILNILLYDEKLEPLTNLNTNKIVEG